MFKRICGVCYVSVSVIWSVRGSLWASELLCCPTKLKWAFAILAALLALTVSAGGCWGQFEDLVKSVLLVACMPIIMYALEWVALLVIVLVDLFFKIFGWENFGDGVVLIIIILVVIWMFYSGFWIFFL